MSARRREETPPVGEPTRHGLRVTILVGFIAVVVFGIGVAGAALLQFSVTGWLRPPDALPETLVERPELGPVDKLPFDVEPVLSRRDRQLARLRSYGWVDRERGVAHVPIEVAMDQVAGEAGK